MEEKELEIEVRRWLEYVLNKGTYDARVLIALKGLYYRGRSDAQKEIKEILGIENCICE